jgi:hypothetical protein
MPPASLMAVAIVIVAVIPGSPVTTYLCISVQV